MAHVDELHGGLQVTWPTDPVSVESGHVPHLVAHMTNDGSDRWHGVGPYFVLTRVLNVEGTPVEGDTHFLIGSGAVTYDLAPGQSVDLHVLVRHDIGTLGHGQYLLAGRVTDLGIDLPVRDLVIA